MFNSRFTVWRLTILIGIILLPISLYFSSTFLFLLSVLLFLLFILGIYDYYQNHHSVLRNYPIIGHIRFLFEFIRPEIRQYFIENDEEKIPFSRNQRAMVYQRSKQQNDKRGFGTIKQMYEPGTEWLCHSNNPTEPDINSFRVKVGGDQCKKHYSMSIFNISAMSFGALSPNAVKALNHGAKMGNFAHDTGEGSISVHHKEFGGDLIWEIGSGYFGCRNNDGTFSEKKFSEQIKNSQIKMIEIKLSQGAKPGHGGVLPGSKVNSEIAEARGIPIGEDCISPANHSAFNSPLELIEFINLLRNLSNGIPVGFKLCVGQPWQFFGIVKAMLEKNIFPDFIVVDGSEGGTGAAPVEFSDHMGMPLREGLHLVHNALVGVNKRDQIKIGASGKIISGYDIARAIALGADFCNSARGFMFALGCIQSRSCHTDHCPSGVATQDKQRQRALVVSDKAHRVKDFHYHTVESLVELVGAAGLNHPKEITSDHIMVRDSDGNTVKLTNNISQVKPKSLLTQDALDDSSPTIFKDYWKQASTKKFGLN